MARTSRDHARDADERSRSSSSAPAMPASSWPPRCGRPGSTARSVLIGDEPVLPYQRPPLSKDYLDGKIGLDLLLMRPEAFYRDHRIEFLAGTRVDGDRPRRQDRAARRRRASRLRPSRARDRRAQPGAAAARHRARRRVLSAHAGRDRRAARAPRRGRAGRRDRRRVYRPRIRRRRARPRQAGADRRADRPGHGPRRRGADLAFLRRGASRAPASNSVSARRRCGSPGRPAAIPAGSIMSNWRAASGSAPISCWSASASCRTASWPPRRGWRSATASSSTSSC